MAFNEKPTMRLNILQIILYFTILQTGAAPLPKPFFSPEIFTFISRSDWSWPKTIAVSLGVSAGLSGVWWFFFQRGKRAPPPSYCLRSNDAYCNCLRVNERAYCDANKANLLAGQAGQTTSASTVTAPARTAPPA